MAIIIITRKLIILLIIIVIAIITIITLTGLESTTKGNIITKFAEAFISKGFGCCLVSFRGCSGEMNRLLNIYRNK